MDLSGLRVGRPVHGAVGEVTLSGYLVDFQHYRGFLPFTDFSEGTRLSASDEVEAWIADLDPHLGWIRLTARSPRIPPPPNGRGWNGIRPDLTPPGRPPVRMGEGVPFFELYMRRRSKRSWSRG